MYCKPLIWFEYFVFSFLHIFRKNYIAGHSPPYSTPKNVLPVPLSRYTQFKFQAELGPRQHCRENVTMFSVHTIVVYCYYCRLLTIPCGYSTMRLQDYSYFFGSLMLNFFVVLSLSRSLNNCDVPSFDTESKHFLVVYVTKALVHCRVAVAMLKNGRWPSSGKPHLLFVGFRSVSRNIGKIWPCDATTTTNTKLHNFNGFTQMTILQNGFQIY